MNDPRIAGLLAVIDQQYSQLRKLAAANVRLIDEKIALRERMISMLEESRNEYSSMISSLNGGGAGGALPAPAAETAPA